MRFRRLTISIFVLLAFGICPDQGNAQLLKSPDTPKSPNKAVRLSAIPTIATMFVGGVLLAFDQHNEIDDYNSYEGPGFVIWSAGVTFGPSLGYSYSENPSRARTGQLIRGASILTSFFLFHYGKSSETDRGTAQTMNDLALALRLFAVGSAAYDIFTVKKSVREYNRRHDLARIQMTPIYLANQKAPGLGVRFNL